VVPAFEASRIAVLDLLVGVTKDLARRPFADVAAATIDENLVRHRRPRSKRLPFYR
jgi:hypothetical protein